MLYATVVQNLINLLKSKWLWYAVLLVVVYYVVRKNWFNLQQFTAPSFVEPSVDSHGNIIPITAARQKQLRTIASGLYLNIHSWYGFTNYDNLLAASQASDAELKYIATYYASVLNKTNKQASLYSELDGLWMPFTDYDNKILLRLAQMSIL